MDLEICQMLLYLHLRLLRLGQIDGDLALSHLEFDTLLSPHVGKGRGRGHGYRISGTFDDSL